MRNDREYCVQRDDRTFLEDLDEVADLDAEYDEDEDDMIADDDTEWDDDNDDN